MPWVLALREMQTFVGWSMKSGKKQSRRWSRSVCQLGVGVLAGGMMFVGQAKATTVLSESFETSPSPFFGAFSSYAYSQNYTSAVIPPGAGDNYFTGTSGLAQNTVTANVALSGGATDSQIDAGLGKFNLSAYFTTYYSQNDWSSVTVQFKDASSNPIGNPTTIGGLTFVSALGSNAAGARDWGQDLAAGDIPVGARSADVALLTQRLQGTAADGYVDLIQLDVSASVPEPSSLAAMAAAGLLALRRKRLKPR